MQRITFTQVSLEGFRSYEDKTFDLNRPGVNLMVGLNGSGKTTLFEAISWCLYKVTLKGTLPSKVGTWEELRTDNWKGTRVITEFICEQEGKSDEYIVARHINYKGITAGFKGGNSLMILKNGELLSEEQHKGDQEAYLIRLLGVDSRAFINSILFGQRMNRLVEMSGEDKRKLFDQLFDMEFIGQAKEKAKAELDSLNLILNKQERGVDMHVTKLQGAQDMLEREKAMMDEWENEHKDRLEEVRSSLSREVKFLSTSEAKLKRAKSKMDELEVPQREELDAREREKWQEWLAAKEQFAKLQESYGGWKSSMSNLAVKKQKLENDLIAVETVCPYCGRNLQESQVRGVKDKIIEQISRLTPMIEAKPPMDYAAEVKKQEKALSQLHDEYQEVLVQVNSIKSMEKVYNEALNEVSILERDVKIRKQVVKDLKQRAQYIENKKKPAIDIEARKREIETIEENIRVMQQKLEDGVKKRNRINWWVDKGFSASGIKAFIFSAMLNKLNMYAEKYAERLGTRIKFSVDLSKPSKPFTTYCYVNGLEKDYNDFSGGEKQRIDVCLAFSMYDLVGHRIDTNLLIMDEVFDSLDAAGIEVIFDLVRAKAEDGKSVYVVSHMDTVDSMYCKHIYVEKENGATKIIA